MVEKIFQKIPLTGPLSSHSVPIVMDIPEIISEFIPEQVYNGDFTCGQMSKHFRILLSKPSSVSSFVARCESLGSPIPYRKPRPDEDFSWNAKKIYRCSDVIARALSDGFEILPPYWKDLRRDEEALERRISVLRDEVSRLEDIRSDLNRVFEFDSIAFKFGLKALYGADEIVRSSRLYSDLDSVCGVYFLISRGEIVYVGQSVNVFSRMHEHRKYKDFDSYAYISCAREDLNVLESLYIHCLRPVLQGRVMGTDAMSAPIALSKLLEMGRR